MDKWIKRIGLILWFIVLPGVIILAGGRVVSAATDSQLGQGLSAMVEGLVEFFKAVVDLILGLP